MLFTIPAGQSRFGGVGIDSDGLDAEASYSLEPRARQGGTVDSG